MAGKEADVYGFCRRKVFRNDVGYFFQEFLVDFIKGVCQNQMFLFQAFFLFLGNRYAGIAFEKASPLCQQVIDAAMQQAGAKGLG